MSKSSSNWLQDFSEGRFNKNIKWAWKFVLWKSEWCVVWNVWWVDINITNLTWEVDDTNVAKIVIKTWTLALEWKGRSPDLSGKYNYLVHDDTQEYCLVNSETWFVIEDLKISFQEVWEEDWKEVLKEITYIFWPIEIARSEKVLEVLSSGEPKKSTSRFKKAIKWVIFAWWAVWLWLLALNELWSKGEWLVKWTINNMSERASNLLDSTQVDSWNQRKIEDDTDYQKRLNKEMDTAFASLVNSDHAVEWNTIFHSISKDVSLFDILVKLWFNSNDRTCIIDELEKMWYKTRYKDDVIAYNENSWIEVSSKWHSKSLKVDFPCKTTK